ncbi:bifunctional phosphoribosyl-AMP cyclohydrolase/phosphoribosyl-ATP diphosphatase HisIE, partial [Microcoleus sp. herbarium13]|uniref:bifunctional phosphoribosyl-AMP cyclohydrolase/phosphoribosyl-ATP diphosphatase HisIE n=1 Tax=Microcoleus sp. herbarium13 TaxID=3055438 RepID=UPI002FD1D661
KVTFFSRSKNRLWTKGEASGNFLELQSSFQDCDSDTVLFMARPVGPVCHTGSDTCFDEPNPADARFLEYLETYLHKRSREPIDKSYTARLLAQGINKVAQKVGEEAIELVIEAKDQNAELFLGEAADLLFHYLLLLQAKDFMLKDVLEVLARRHKS